MRSEPRRPWEIILLDERTDPHALLEAGANPEIMRWVKAGLLDGAGGVLSTPGVIALGAPPPEIELSSLQPGPQDLLLVACGISDPGNLGALARAAEAAGARALVQVAGRRQPLECQGIARLYGKFVALARGVRRPRQGKWRKLSPPRVGNPWPPPPAKASPSGNLTGPAREPSGSAVKPAAIPSASLILTR